MTGDAAGHLTVADLSGLNLADGLAFLSACETIMTSPDPMLLS